MCKVFYNEELNDQARKGEIIHIGLYHKYRTADGKVNPDFKNDIFSKRILDLKGGKEEGYNFFEEMVDSIIEKDITVCVVPSHEASNCNIGGIAEFAKRLAAKGRIDKTDYLLRTKSIDKLSLGGSRNRDVHMNSITTNENMTVSGDVILLVDDVTTSGTSLEVCKDILMANGADSVAMLALGKSI